MNEWPIIVWFILSVAAFIRAAQNAVSVERQLNVVRPGDGTAYRLTKFKQRWQRGVLIAASLGLTIAAMVNFWPDPNQPPPAPPTFRSVLIILLLILIGPGLWLYIGELVHRFDAYVRSLPLSPEDTRILEEIAKQFKTDGGFSLRDVVNRLDKGVVRLEEGIARMEAADKIVAVDLKDSEARADAEADGEPGEAADAGSQSAEGHGQRKDSTDE